MILFYLTIVVIVNHFLLGMLLLFAPKISNIANKLLGGQLISFGAIHLTTLFFYYPQAKIYEHLIGIDYAIGACVGPFIYLYVYSYIKGDLPGRKILFGHFIIPLVFITGFIVHKISSFQDELGSDSMVMSHYQYIADSLVFGQGLLYIIAAYFIYKKTLKRYSLRKKVQLKWLQTYFVCTFIFIACVVPLGMIQNGHLAGMYISLFSMAYFIVLIWQSLASSKTFGSSSNGLESNHYELSKEISDLLQIIESRRLFANKDFSIELLAFELNMNKQQIMYIFHNQNGNSFSDHINNLRIKEAQKLLLDPKFNHITIEAIGLNVGFGSRSTFYEIFKKSTGKTPSEFKLQRKAISD